jgi:hypothetical protein
VGLGDRCDGRALSATCSLRCSQWARPTTSSNGGAVPFPGIPRRLLCRRGCFPFTRRTGLDQSSVRLQNTRKLKGALLDAVSGGSAWLMHETLPEVEVLKKIRSGDVLFLLREKPGGVHWACWDLLKWRLGLAWAVLGHWRW